MVSVDVEPARPAPPPKTGPVLDVVVPVYNESRGLTSSIGRLRDHLDSQVPWPAVVTIADNGSTDATPALADRLAAELPGVRVIHLSDKGRGRALRTAWSTSDADVLAYMDVDLSTSLEALLPLVAPLVSGHSDLAIGTRLARGARVRRGPKREVVSRGYNLVLHAFLRNSFSDAQCGFKAIRADVARTLLPDVADESWFFDTELLVLAERRTCRIHEVPVDWVDDPDSRVDIVKTATDDLRGVWRLLRRGDRSPAASREEPAVAFSRLAGFGALSTASYLTLFLLLRTWLDDYLSSALALALCTLASTLALRLAWAGDGAERLRRAFLAGGAVWGVHAALTSLALLVAHRWQLTSLGLVVALVAATAVAAPVRFLLLRAWTFTAAHHAAGSLERTP